MKSLISASMIVCFLALCSAHAEHLTAPGIDRDLIHSLNHSDYTFDTDTTELDEFIITTMEDCHIPGAAACIIKNGAIVWSGVYGWANIEDSIPVADTTLFMLASISKTVTGTAVMQLWEEELFELDADVNDYLTFRVRNPQHPLSPITYQMLLTHTSSIADYWPMLNSLYVFWSDSPVPLDEFLENYLIEGGDYYASQNFKWWSPGTDFQYSSVGGALLGHLVERITGTSFDEYCRNSIFYPLGMDQTSWFLEGLDPDNIAMPYEWNGSFYEPYGQYGFPFYPAGQLRSNMIELSRFLIAFMQNGQFDTVRILDSTTVDMMFTIQHPDIDENQGLIWYQMDIDGRLVWLHAGGDWGVLTCIAYYPEEGSGVMLLTNGSALNDESRWGVYLITDALFDYAVETGVPDADDPKYIPRDFALQQNHPNPFNSRTTISYSLPEECEVTISIYNLLGQRVATLHEGPQEAGEHTVVWDISEFPSGVYFARLETGEHSENIKMVLLK